MVKSVFSSLALSLPLRMRSLKFLGKPISPQMPGAISRSACCVLLIFSNTWRYLSLRMLCFLFFSNACCYLSLRMLFFILLKCLALAPQNKKAQLAAREGKLQP